MLNILSKITTELPSQTASIYSFGQVEQFIGKMEGLKYKITTITDKGCNKLENEDSVLAKYRDTPIGPSLLLAVADGVGGLKYGAEASRTAVASLEHWWSVTLKAIMYSNTENIHYLINESLSAALHKINTDIYECSVKRDEKMATTISVVFIINDWYCIKHAGDSRIYLITKEMLQITEDHNLFNQLLNTGHMEEIKCGYKALNNVLTKCLGIKPELELFERTGKISEAEGMLLCSDGLYKLLSTVEICRGIRMWSRNTEELRQGLQWLIDKARQRGERDDITVVAMLTEGGPKSAWYKLAEFMVGRL